MKAWIEFEDGVRCEMEMPMSEIFDYINEVEGIKRFGIDLKTEEDVYQAIRELEEENEGTDNRRSN